MNIVAKGAAREILLLSLAAGSADAAGFLGLGHVFTSNMTGNVVLLGIAIGQGHLPEATRSLFVLVVFMTGVCLASWMSRGMDEKDWPRLVMRVVSVEAILLGIFGVFWCLLTEAVRAEWAYALITLLALAMGLQACAMLRLNVPGATTTAVTGTLTGLVSGVIQVLTPSGLSPLQLEETRKKMAFQGLVVGLYCGGAVVTCLFLNLLPPSVGFFPAALLVAIVIMQMRRVSEDLA